MDRCSLHSHFADAGAHTKGDIQRYSLAGRELHALRNFSPEPFLLHTEVVKRSCGGGRLPGVKPPRHGVRPPTPPPSYIIYRVFWIPNNPPRGNPPCPEAAACTLALPVGSRCA